MPLGFYIIMAAQFFSSLADNALLVAAIALLLEMHSPPWLTPMLKFFFTVSYVAFAAFVGAFADSMPKGRVMFITNTVKIAGCLIMFFYQALSGEGIAAYVVVLFAYSLFPGRMLELMGAAQALPMPILVTLVAVLLVWLARKSIARGWIR